MMHSVTIRWALPDDAQLRELIHKLDQDLLTRYPPEEIFGMDFEDPGILEAVFAVAEVNGQPAGCAALRPLGGRMLEMKRVYVADAFRKRGVASALIRFLEGWAVRQGYAAIRLETGAAQPESLGLYAKFGYKAIERYGAYVHCPSSLCFEKTLQDSFQ